MPQFVSNCGFGLCYLLATTLAASAIRLGLQTPSPLQLVSDIIASMPWPAIPISL
jgi:hypothetical protein